MFSWENSLACALSAFVLVACGGGGSGATSNGSTTDQPVTLPATSAAFAGIWTGSYSNLNFPSAGSSVVAGNRIDLSAPSSAVALSDGASQVHILYNGASNLLAGSFSTPAGTSALTITAPTVYYFNSTNFTDGPFTGSLLAKKSFSGQWNIKSDTGQLFFDKPYISVSYDSTSTAAANLPSVSGTFVNTAGGGTLTVNTTGGISGVIGACKITGSASTSNPAVNVYATTLTMSTNNSASACALNGFTTSGLSAVLPSTTGTVTSAYFVLSTFNVVGAQAARMTGAFKKI